MIFLPRRKLQTAIKEISKSQILRCAVAFWGDGAEKMIGSTRNRDIKIICNLQMGGTNPKVIECFRKSLRGRIKQNDTLHAKVYIGDNCAIVGSANASANGLGFEGAEQMSWEEAAVKISDKHMIRLIEKWFDDLWANTEKCREISDSDMVAAQESWNRRRKTLRPNSFRNFDLENGTPPLLDYTADSEWKLVKRLPRTRRIEIGDEEDKKVLRKGTWVVQWKRPKRGKKVGRHALRWFNVGEIVPDALQDGHSGSKDAALPAKKPPSKPFSLDDQALAEAFETAIFDSKYEKLREDFDGAWFTPDRLHLMKCFWHDVKKSYRPKD